MTMVPPELVPEYPSALFSIHMWFRITSHCCRQAPTYVPESFMLLA